jgi:hypothetical protein
MKKIFTAILLATSLVASAADWRSVGDNKNGDARLLVDVQSLGVGVADKGVDLLVYGMFTFFSDGEVQEPYAFVVFAESCISGQGLLSRRKKVEGKWVTDKKYWWSTDGDKMFDTIGSTLCASLNKKETPHKQSNKKGQLDV